MIGVHIHDVFGITDHLVPGQGSVNYGKIADYLPDNCLKTLEIGPQASIEEIAKGLELLTSAGIINRL
jgi:sugar phosphate isomerase/epimerase